VSEQPRVNALLKVDDYVIGEITINPDGSFKGTIEDGAIHATMVVLLRDGLADGVVIKPNVVPAVRGFVS
jgi:hypothetical protein